MPLGILMPAPHFIFSHAGKVGLPLIILPCRSDAGRRSPCRPAPVPPRASPHAAAENASGRDPRRLPPGMDLTRSAVRIASFGKSPPGPGLSPADKRKDRSPIPGKTQTGPNDRSGMARAAPSPDRRLSSSGTIPSPCPALARIILLQSPFLSRGSSADRSRPQPREILTQKGDALSGHPLSFISVSAWRPDAPFQCFPAVAGQVRRSGTDASKRPPSHFPKETLRHDTGISAWQPECGQWLW